MIHVVTSQTALFQQIEQTLPDYPCRHFITERDLFTASDAPALILCPGDLALGCLARAGDIPVVVLGEADDTEAEIVPMIRAGAADYVVSNRLERLPEVVSRLLGSAHHLTDPARLLKVSNDSSVITLFSVNTAGELVGVYGNGLSAIGLETEDVLGQPISEWSGELGALESFVAHALGGNRVSGLVEGRDLVWDVQCSPIYNPGGDLIGVVGVAVDVTISTLTWQELKKSDNRFNMIFRTMPVAMVIISRRAGRILSANEHFIDLIGYSYDEVIGSTLADLNLLPEAAEIVMTTPDLSDHDARLLTRTGDDCPVLIATAEMELLDQTCLLVTLQDMTRYQQAQAAIQESERKFRMIFDEATDVIMIIDAATGRIEMVNQVVVYIMGYAPDDLIGQHFSVLFPAEGDETAILDELRVYGAVFESQKFRQANGAIMPMDLSARIIDWRGHQSVLITLRDIQERIAAEEALRQMERRLQMVIDNAPIILFTLDANGYFTLSEGKGLAALGIEPGGLVGRAASDVFAAVPDLLSDIRRALAGETMYTMREIDGKIFEKYHTPMLDADGQVRGVIGLGVEVTERERARQTQQEAERAQMEMQKEREMMIFREGFMSLLSHEFKNPLSILIFSSETLRSRRERLTPEQQARHIEKIHEASQRMSQLIEDVMMISSARAGKFDFQPQQMDLTALSREIIRRLGLGEAGGHAFTLTATGPVESVNLDRRMVDYIITNLLGNAIKYTPVVGGSIRFTLQREDDYVVIEVADNGIGIPEKDQKRIFDSFHRGGNTGDIKGTGLGLAMVKFCVDEHGGTVDLASQEGQGTTFTVRLPC